MKIAIFLLLPILASWTIWKQQTVCPLQTGWWETVGLLICTSLAIVVAADLFLWRRFKRYIHARIDERIDRHDRACPARKELLLRNTLPTDEAARGSEAFRRSFQAAHPTYVLTLRERVPTITPAEELLCMYTQMGLSNKEVADRMSISINSIHTVRYRLKRKLPLQEGESMDDWIRNLE